jgi:hypothetical protein
MASKNDENVRGVDQALRQRVMDGMSIVSDDELHESTDKLMRALGRVLIEIGLQRSLPHA